MPVAHAAEPRAARLIAIAICLGAAASVALGQAEGVTDLSFNIRNSESLTDADRKAIDRYVQHWVAQMISGASASQIAEAKDKLSAMLEGSSGKTFRDAYSTALGSALVPAAAHEQVQVRLSAMIAAAGASNGAVADVCNRGLADPNVGVRYQAAKAVADILERRVRAEPSPFNPTQQQALLATLRKSMSAEDSELVVQQMGRAISHLTIPAAFQESLAVLEQRLQWLRAHPQEVPRAAPEMLRNLRLQLVEREVMAQDVRQPLLDLTAVAGRYLRLLAERIAAGQVPPDAQAAWSDLIEIVESDVFKPAIEKFAPDAQGQGPSLSSRIRRGQWGSSDLGADIAKWIGAGDRPGLLTSSALNIPMAKLALPPLETQGVPASTPTASDVRR